MYCIWKNGSVSPLSFSADSILAHFHMLNVWLILVTSWLLVILHTLHIRWPDRCYIEHRLNRLRIWNMLDIVQKCPGILTAIGGQRLRHQCPGARIHLTGQLRIYKDQWTQLIHAFFQRNLVDKMNRLAMRITSARYREKTNTFNHKSTFFCSCDSRLSPWHNKIKWDSAKNCSLNENRSVRRRRDHPMCAS